MGAEVWLNLSRMRPLEGINFFEERLADNHSIEDDIHFAELKEVLANVMDLFFGEILTAEEAKVVKLRIGLTPDGPYALEDIPMELGTGYCVEHVERLTATALRKFHEYLPTALKLYEGASRAEKIGTIH